MNNDKITILMISLLFLIMLSSNHVYSEVFPGRTMSPAIQKGKYAIYETSNQTHMWTFNVTITNVTADTVTYSYNTISSTGADSTNITYLRPGYIPFVVGENLAIGDSVCKVSGKVYNITDTISKTVIGKDRAVNIVNATTDGILIGYDKVTGLQVSSNATMYGHVLTSELIDANIFEHEAGSNVIIELLRQIGTIINNLAHSDQDPVMIGALVICVTVILAISIVAILVARNKRRLRKSNVKGLRQD